MDFYSLTASSKNLAQSRWVSGGLSALGDRSTFMPTRKKQTRQTNIHNLKRKLSKQLILIKDSLSHSSWRRGFVQNASETEDFESDSKIVKFVVVKKRTESHAEKEDLMSFEALTLPHLDAAHNLAKWLLRNEQDAQDVVQEAYLRAFKSFGGFYGSNGRAWLLKVVRNTSYTLLKKNRAVDLTTTFDEEIHATGHDSASPATILELAEDAELIRKAMEELPVESREILTLRHQEGLSYKEIADVAQIPPGTVMSRLARARAKLKECLAARIGNEK
jgi:RNA polymerase sigma-70 factor (ECF subfamily)